MRRRLERNNVIICTKIPGLVAEYCLRNIFTIDVTQLEFRRSPVAGESAEEAFKEELSTDDDAAEKMQPVMVVISERRYLGHI